MFRSVTVSVSVAAPPGVAYDFASDPRHLPDWAGGFVSAIERRGSAWVAQTSLGEATFRFAPRNAFGVLDHDVELPAGSFHNPMRVIPNGTGCEILFTLLQLPGTDDAAFAADAETVRGDLLRLRQQLEALAPGVSP
jgi:Polyketide cyclase / dehydrase and lipid transport